MATLQRTVYIPRQKVYNKVNLFTPFYFNIPGQIDELVCIIRGTTKNIFDFIVTTPLLDMQGKKYMEYLNVSTYNPYLTFTYFPAGSYILYVASFVDDREVNISDYVEFEVTGVTVAARQQFAADQAAEAAAAAAEAARLKAIQDALDAAKNTVNTTTETGAATSQGIINNVNVAINNDLGNSISTISQAVTGIAAGVNSSLSTGLESIASVLGGVSNSMLSGIVDMSEGIQDTFTGITDSLASDLTGSLSIIGNTVNSVASTISSSINSGIAEIKYIFNSIIGSVLNNLLALLNAFPDLIAKALISPFFDTTD